MKQLKLNYNGLQFMFIFKMMALKNIWLYLPVILYLSVSIILSSPGVLIWSSEIFSSACNMIGYFSGIHLSPIRGETAFQKQAWIGIINLYKQRNSLNNLIAKW